MIPRGLPPRPKVESRIIDLVVERKGEMEKNEHKTNRSSLYFRGPLIVRNLKLILWANQQKKNICESVFIAFPFLYYFPSSAIFLLKVSVCPMNQILDTHKLCFLKLFVPNVFVMYNY